ncbi:hypothetical protein D3C71_2030100 [compost metagenome]
MQAPRPTEGRPATGGHIALLTRLGNDVHGLTVHLSVHPFLLVHGLAKLNGLSGKRQGTHRSVLDKAHCRDTKAR